MPRSIQVAAAVLVIAAAAGSAGAQPAGATYGARTAALAAAPAQPALTPSGSRTSPTEKPAAAAARAVATPHGSWTHGPGTYSFTICAAGVRAGSPVGEAAPLFQRVALTTSAAPATCDVVLPSGTTASIAIQVWSGGGGGGGGMAGGSQAFTGLVGVGGQGGGGGGYATLTQTVAAPLTGSVVWTVAVGAGGTAGAALTATSAINGQYQGGKGGASQVRVGAGGPVLVSATGGGGGNPAQTQNGNGGLPGHGSVNGWTGTAGYIGGAMQICSGGAGGLGGAGGGPGRINDGGAGGHGGYTHSFPHCTSAGQDYQLAAGLKGGDGKVVLTW